MAIGAILGAVGSIGSAVSGIFTAKAQVKTAEVQRDIVGIQGKNNVLMLQEQQKLQKLANDNANLQGILAMRVSENQLKSNNQKTMVYAIVGLIALLVIMKKS